jgi:tetratricopeptide (TPR) repeat protein
MRHSTRISKIPAWIASLTLVSTLAAIRLAPARAQDKPADPPAPTPDAQGPAPIAEDRLHPLRGYPPNASQLDPRDATVLIRVASSLRRGRGSGFVVGDGGWVVTAYHVVAADFGEGRTAPEGAVMVLSPWTGHWYEAQVRAFDVDADLALLRLEVTGLPALALDRLEEKDPAALAAAWKELELQLTGFPAELGSDARADQVAADLSATKFVQMGQRGRGAICFLEPCKVGPGWSGGPVTRADTGAAIAVFHSLYRPGQAGVRPHPAAALLFQLLPLIRSAGAEPAQFTRPAPPTQAHAPDAADRVARQIRSVTLATQGDWKRVEAEQQENLRREGESAEAHFLLGLARAAEGDVEAAVRELREADRLHPGSALIPLNLGLALQKKGEAAAAEAEFRRALARCPADTEARLGLALALEDQNRLKDAEQVLAEARAASPNHPAPRYQLGLLLLKQNRNDEALKELRAVAELVGEREAFLNMRVAYARALEAANRNDQAEREYRTVTRRDPSNGEAHFYLANLLIKTNRKAEARLELARLKRLPSLDAAFSAKLKEMEERLK